MTAAGFGYPRGYKVDVSTDGTSWKSVAEAAATGNGTVVTLAPTPAKFIRLTLTTSPANAPAWSLQELKVFGKK